MEDMNTELDHQHWNRKKFIMDTEHETQKVAAKIERIRMRSETRKCLPDNMPLHIMHVRASADGTAQWLGKLEKDPLGTNCYFKKKSVMPDNSQPRSPGWCAVFAALDKGDLDALGLLRNLMVADRLETTFGLDHKESGWSIFHKAVAFDRVYCCKELLAEGVSCTMQDRKGNSPMNIAVWFNSKKCHALLDTETKKLHGAKQKGRLKTGVLSAFASSGERSKVKRKTKESQDRLERKTKELGISTTPPHQHQHKPVSLASIVPVTKLVMKSGGSVRSVNSASSGNSVGRLSEALGRIDGSAVDQGLDSWSQSGDNSTIESTFSTASTSTLDNWYSQLPPTKKDRMQRRPGLWGIADSEKHELKRVGQQQRWVKRKKAQSRLLRFVKRNLLTAGPEVQERKSPPREVRFAVSPS